MQFNTSLRLQKIGRASARRLVAVQVQILGMYDSSSAGSAWTKAVLNNLTHQESDQIFMRVLESAQRHADDAVCLRVGPTA